MWKYVAFVLLIVFSVPAVLGQAGQGDPSPETNDTSPADPTNSTTPTTDPSVTSTTSSTDPPTTPSTNPPTTPSTDPPTTPSTDPPTTPEVTSSKVTTVPPPPPTTPLPPPNVGKYSIHEKGDVNKTTCLRVEMALRVSIHDQQALYYNFPGNASTEGSDCNVSNAQVLKLTAEDLKQSLTLIFVQDDKKNYVKDVMFTYFTPEKKTVNTSGHFFSAAEGNSYLCHSDVTIKVENVTLTFSSVHVQAFGADTFGRAEECDADDKVGDIVPIAVGCALGALVIIVLIAYLVGRRRSHQKGYQSV